MLENLFLFLVNRSISASWLILVVIILRLFLKRASRKIVCFLWILVAVRLLIPFSPESAFSLIPSQDTFRLAEKEEMVTLPLTDTSAEDKMQEDLQNVNTGYGKDSAGQRVLLIRTGFEKLDAALEWLLERSHGKTVSDLSKVEKEATDTKDERESSPENMDVSSGILADENLLETINSVGNQNFAGTGNSAVIGNPSGTMNPAENGILVGTNPKIQASPSLLEIVSCVWLAGTVVLLSGSLLSYLLLRRKVRIYVEKTPRVRYCDEIDTPFILGLLCPKIYIPSNLGTAEKEYVLAHERAHLESWDSGRKAIGYVLLSIYWMNPLIWAGYALFCRDLEIACDERVIEGKDLTYRKAYAMALLSCSVPGRRITAYPLAFGEVSVKKRIRSVLGYRKPRVWNTAAGVLLCGIVLLCFLTDPEGSGKTFAQNSHGAEQIPLVSPEKWEDAYRSLYQTWTAGGGEEDAPFVQLHDFDGDEIPEMMLLDGTETLHIYSYSAEEKRVDTVAEMSVMGAVYCWGNVIAARTPEYHTVYFTYANGRYYTGIAHLGSAEIDQRWVTDEEFGTVFPVYVKGSLSNYNGMTDRAEKFGQFDLGNIVIEGQEQGESPFCLVSELEDLEDYYDVVNAYLSVRKGQGAGKQYTVVSGFIRGTCFADIFFEDEEGKVEQTVHYRYDEPYQYYDEQGNAYYLGFDKWPFTNEQEPGEYGEEWPIRWEDVDHDGYQDILFCMRIFQTGGNYGCFLYDPETNDYLPCKGFEEIPAPDLRGGNIRGMIRGGYTEFKPIYTHYKYEITEDLSIELVGRLEDLFMGADSYSYRYNEEHYENGVTVYKKENVEREEVDIDYWNGYID